MNYARDRGLLAIPTTRGLAVYRIDVRQGIQRLGDIAHEFARTEHVADLDMLPSVRSVFLRDRVVSVGADAARVRMTDDMEHDAGTVSWDSL